MAEEQVNLNIVEGEPFFAHELSVNFTPTQLILDFKCITPRIDPRSKNKPSFQLRHNVVMLEPWHAKTILEVLNTTLKKYEEQFGKIEKPKSVKAVEKKQKEAQKKAKQATAIPSTVTTEAPTYLG